MTSEIDKDKIVAEWIKEKIEKEWCCDEDQKKRRKKDMYRTGGAGFYFVGFIGVAVYYIGIADSFWIGVLGFLKACVWPAFMVYDLLKFIGA